MRDETYPRIRDLPEAEQELFREWLQYATRPLIDAPSDEQDAYYQWDYDSWKRYMRGDAVVWC